LELATTAFSSRQATENRVGYVGGDGTLIEPSMRTHIYDCDDNELAFNNDAFVPPVDTEIVIKGDTYVVQHVVINMDKAQINIWVY